MKVFWGLFLFIFTVNIYAVGNQGTGYIVPQGTTVRINEHGTCKKVNNGTSSYHFFIGAKAASEWNSFVANPPTGTTLTNCDATYRSCLDIKKANPAATSGKYTIDVDGPGGYPAIDTYCDMTTDGGGWTLVWSNTRAGTNKPTKNLSWVNATQTTPRCSQAQGAGTGCGHLGNDKEAFNYFVGIDWWNRISGNKKNIEFMYQWSSNYGRPIEQMSKFNIQRTNESKLFVMDASNLSLLTGETPPGIFTYHFTDKYPLSASDVRNDIYGIIGCSATFEGTPFWYGACWSGSIVGGAENSTSYKNAAYYASSHGHDGNENGLGGGNGWFFIREYDYLSSCTEIKSRFPLAPSGKYWIDPDGAGGNAPLFVKCDMETDGGGWTLLMNQEVDKGGFFTEVQAALNDIDNPDSPLYSILERTEGFRSLHGNFTFKINWPGHSQRNIWRQRTNPAVDGPVEGYRPIAIDASGEDWGGVERNCVAGVGCSKSFIDGSVGSGDWYYAVATYEAYHGGIPSAESIAESVNQSQLWVRDDSFLLREPRDCQEILEYGLSRGDDLYWVDPTGSGVSTQVYCDMTTDGGGWTRVFNHHIAGGYFPEASDAMSKDPATPNANLYSILDRLDDFKANGRYIFKINWPGYTPRNTWIQTTNPTIDQPVGGYVGLAIDSTVSRWGGLERNCAIRCDPSLMDGTVGHQDWFYAIGSYQAYGTPAGIPSSTVTGLPDTAGAPHAQLWTRRAEGIFTKRSCKEILEAGLSTGDGSYYIDPDGVGGQLPFRVYCDMTTNGGGWTRVAYSKGTAAVVPNDFMVNTYNKHHLDRTDYDNMAASINSEWFSRVVGTTDAMFKASAYSITPYIENGMGTWNYDVAKCSGTLLHTSRTAGCSGQGGNDNYNTADMFNIAILGGAHAIVPYYRNHHAGELCYSGKGNCSFEFYLR